MVPPKLAGPSGPAPASPGAIMFGRAWAQVRLWVQMAAFAAGLAAFVSPASATLTVVSANPTTYTYAGEVITFNYTFTADTHIINSVFYSVQGNVSVSALNCTGLPLSPNATTTCTATHTVQPGEVGDVLHLGDRRVDVDPRHRLIGADLPHERSRCRLEPGRVLRRPPALRRPQP